MDYPLSDSVIEGKRVLIVDDIVDTGESMIIAKTYVESMNPREVRTVSLQYIGSSKLDPDSVFDLKIGLGLYIPGILWKI